MVSQRDRIFLIKVFKGGVESISKADHCRLEGMGVNGIGPCVQVGSSKRSNKGLTRLKRKVSPRAIRGNVVPRPKDRGKLLLKLCKMVHGVGGVVSRTVLKRLACPDLVTLLRRLEVEVGLNQP